MKIIILNNKSQPTFDVQKITFIETSLTQKYNLQRHQ